MASSGDGRPTEVVRDVGPGRISVSRETAASLVAVAPEIELSRRVAALWDQGVRESRELAAGFRALAPSWPEADGSQSALDEAALEEIAVAVALRCTLPRARHRIRTAHRAVHLLPRLFALLVEGVFPAAWFTMLLARTTDLTDTEHELLDATVSSWDGTITAERFERELRRTITLLVSRRGSGSKSSPAEQRRAELLPPAPDGTGCLQLIGPLPEILALGQDLDARARAVQDAQRLALRRGQVPPCDPEGSVAATGRPMALARIRYWLLISALDNAGGGDTLDPTTPPAWLRAARPRFRVNVTVPLLTLMGLSEQPALVDGIHPVPADMARDLAAGEELWHRVLTDPVDGTFLPLPARTYRPRASMREHLRLRGPLCAVPGCTRPVHSATECDHIREFDHRHPDAGGRTEIENLHLLCWTHHDLKTRGLLDPVRENGSTRWSLPGRARVVAEDDRDMATPAIVADYEAAHRAFRARREKGEDPGQPPDPTTDPPPPRRADRPADRPPDPPPDHLRDDPPPF